MLTKTMDEQAAPQIPIAPQPTPQPSYSAAAPASSRSFLVAYLLSQFLGFLGADRFYLGYTGKGLLKLCTLGGCGVWWLLDQLLLIAGRLRSKDGGQFQDYEAYRRLTVVIFVCAWTLFGVSVAYVVSTLTKPAFPVAVENHSKATGLPPARAATAETPLGETAEGSSGAAGIKVGVAGVIADPQVEGDAPAPGMRYVEIDLTVQNDSGQAMVVPGTFAYRTNTGTILYPAASIGKGSQFANKKVQVAGKQPLEALALDKGQSDDSHYLLYQVPSGDTEGTLIWYDGYFDTSSTKMAVFALQ